MKVRIAVVIDDKGRWNAAGYGEPGKDYEHEAKDIAIDGMGEPDCEVEKLVWVEVEIEPPKVETIQGHVTETTG